MRIQNTEAEFEAIILGGGVSGLVSASMLSAMGVKSILVVDEYPELGGNHISVDCGPYTFDIGSLIFQDDSPLLAHFPELLPLYVPISPDTSRVRPDGKVSPYPFSIAEEIIAPGPITWMRFAISLLQARLTRTKPKDAEGYARYWIGDYLFRNSGLHSYMRRFYGVPPNEIELSFAQKRMHWIGEAASFRKVIKRFVTRKTIWYPNQSMARPRAGFRPLYQAVAEGLTKDGVQFSLGSPFKRLERVGNKFRVETAAGIFTAKRLIATIPIDRALSLFGQDPMPQLPTLHLTSLFYSFEGARAFKTPILYNFGHTGDWKRLTMYSDFYGAVNGRQYFTAEVVTGEAPENLDALGARVADQILDLNVVAGPLRLEGSHILDNAYPIYTHGATDLLDKKQQTLKSLGVESFGRQGGFDYLPTARATTLVAEDAMNAKHQPTGRPA